MPDQPLIDIRNLQKRFGEVTVLDGIDLAVAQGEHLCLIGPSGSGKSTILRLLMTLEEPSGGSILIDGEELWPDGPLDRAAMERQQRLRHAIGMVFQQFNLFPHLKVVENVMLAPRLVDGTARSEARRRACELLDRVGLADKAEAWPQELSGGQKQRVAIARALAMNPRIMLFDEATSALDPELVGEVLAVIEQLAADGDMTMCFVTHQLHFVQRIGGKLAVLDQGRIVEHGAPAEVLRDPQHERTKAFLAALQDG